MLNYNNWSLFCISFAYSHLNLYKPVASTALSTVWLLASCPGGFGIQSKTSVSDCSSTKTTPGFEACQRQDYCMIYCYYCRLEKWSCLRADLLFLSSEVTHCLCRSHPLQTSFSAHCSQLAEAPARAELPTLFSNLQTQTLKGVMVAERSCYHPQLQLLLSF